MPTPDQGQLGRAGVGQVLVLREVLAETAVVFLLPAHCQGCAESVSQRLTSRQLLMIQTQTLVGGSDAALGAPRALAIRRVCDGHRDRALLGDGDSTAVVHVGRREEYRAK